jgi:CHASE2 domain-containing sensor protein
MTKLVMLKFALGSFEQGFVVTLQIGDEGARPDTEITGQLPPASELALYYSHWQSSYRNLGNRSRLSAASVQVTNVSTTQDCQNTAKILKARLNTWLLSDEFRPIREKWLQCLQSTDEIRVILQTENSQLQRLPWYLWDIFERYPKAEIAIASPTYEKVDHLRLINEKVKILAIIGNSQGIDTQADKNLLDALPNADVVFLVEPQRQELTDKLWGENWDILFFAGHSSTSSNDESGRIYLNQTDSLTIGELNYALRKAVDKGLHLAIFNSCDGLGLARELANLQIPQIVVMREPVPDKIAQEFLKYFLQAFANGESFYQAVRQGRERLQGLEDRFPCASWLPVISQNPAHIPSSWESFYTPVVEEKIPLVEESIPISAPIIEESEPKLKGLKTALVTSLLMSAAIFGLRFTGLLQDAEFKAGDQMLQMRTLIKDEGADPRLLLITIDDEDLAFQRNQGEILKGTSISDKYFNQLLEKLEKYQPRAVGVDIYRDFPTENTDLKLRLQKMKNLVIVCKGSDKSVKVKGIAPPKEVPLHRLAYTDFIVDRDGSVRRNLLFMTQEAISICPASYALSTELAFRYLNSKNISPQFTKDHNLQLGSTIFHRLNDRDGAYQRIDANGGQILVNYRASKKVASQKLTLREFLSNQLNPDAVKDKIVLVGVTAKGDLPDYFSTPYSSNFTDKMPGVEIHAHMVSQILSAVLDNRPLLKFLPLTVEIIFVFSSALIGGLILVFYGKKIIQSVVIISCLSLAIYLLYLMLFIPGYWAPFVPSLMALIGTGSVLIIRKHSHLLKKHGTSRPS